MDASEEVSVRLQISRLEAQIELCEIEMATLNRTITSYLASPNSKQIAEQRRNDLLKEKSAANTQLEQLRKAFPSAAKH